jgi:serine/threonine protein kinase
MRFVGTNEGIFTKYCSKELANAISDRPIDEIVRSCGREFTKECNIIKSSMRLGYIANTEGAINRLCNKIQSKRELKFTNNLSQLPHKMCAVNDSIGDYKINDVLGRGTAGSVYKACECASKTCNSNNCVAIKQTPIWSKEEFELVEDIYSEKAMEYQSWVEIVSNMLVTKLIEQNICPNFVGLYHWFYCIDASANGKLGSRLDRSVYIINEVANYGTLAKWLRTARSNKEILSMAFQVYAGLYSMKSQFGMIHGDLHKENVLVNATYEKRSTYSEYIIDKKSYYIPDIGYQFLVADFGRAYIPGKMEIAFHVRENKWYEREMKDYDSDIDNLDWSKFASSFGNVFIPSKIEFLMQMVQKEFGTVPYGYERSETYNLDKRVVVDKQLKRFCL